jgi:serine protease Do
MALQLRAQAPAARLEASVVESVQAARAGVVPVLGHRHRASAPDHQDCRFRIASGIVIHDGLVLTTAPMTNDDALYELVLGERRLPAELEGTDPVSGLALLRVAADAGLRPLPSSDPAQLEAGRFLLVLGYSGSFLPTISLGVAAGVGQCVYSGKIGRFLQFTPLGQLPELGGAVLDLDGRFLGIYPGNPADARGSRTNASVEVPLTALGSTASSCFALPLATVQRLATELAAHGRVRRAWLGVTIEGPNPELESLVGLVRDAPLRIARVDAGSPAAEAGIQTGDRVLTFDGQPVSTLPQLVARIEGAAVGKPVGVRLERHGTVLDLQLHVGERRTAPRQEPTLEWLGVRLANDLLPQPPYGAEVLSGSSRRCVVVREILSPALAAWLGLELGDVIVSIEGHRLEDVAQLEGSTWMGPADGRITLGVLRAGQVLHLEFSPMDVRTDPTAVLLRLLRLEQGLARVLPEQPAALAPAAAGGQ